MLLHHARLALKSPAVARTGRRPERDERFHAHLSRAIEGQTELQTASEMARAVRSGEVSPRELVQRALDRIESQNPRLNAFLTVCDESALAEARRADMARMGREASPPLHGIPIAVKDLHETAGVRTSYGSRRFRDYVPAADCVAVERLREAGAIVVGKTNTPAFGLLGETKNRLGPPCGNPMDPALTAGGSSGGSAAAVAAGIVPVATGTDSAGSINVPAAFCGVCGIKPTWGRVPNWPAPPDSLLLNTTGALTRTVGDAALVLEVMSGHDPRDPVSIREHIPRYRELCREEPGRLRVAFSEDLGLFPVEPDAVATAAIVASRLEAAGFIVEERAPSIDDPIGCYLGLYPPDARRALGDLAPEVCEELYPETLEELQGPRSAEAYVGHLNHLWRLRAAVADFFETYDALIVPTTATMPFPHDCPPDVINGRAVAPGWTSFMPFTPICNLLGTPAASVPAQRGRPGGALIIAPSRREDRVLQLSACAENAAV